MKKKPQVSEPQRFPLAPVVLSVALKLSGILFWLTVVVTVALVASSALTGCGDPPVCQYDREASSPRAVARNLCATWGDFENEIAVVAAVDFENEIISEVAIEGTPVEVGIPKSLIEYAAKRAGDGGYVVVMHSHVHMRDTKFSNADWKSKDTIVSQAAAAGSTLAYFGLVTPGPMISEYWEPVTPKIVLGW